jgi:thiol-disulfide isomerase/thioredoxin
MSSMAIELFKPNTVGLLALSLLIGGNLQAAPAAAPAKAGPTAAQILAGYQPVQKDVQIDRPEAAEIAKCTIAIDKTGYIVRDGSGQMLRNFRDTNGDNTVDQWSYFKDGVEVYRDIDATFNRTPDQARWLNTGGTRWGIDANEDGKIDAWKRISAEEVTAELVSALRDNDRARFERLLLTPKELKALGVGAAKGELLTKKIEAASANFSKLASQQKAINAKTKWVSFGGYQPGMVPAGTEDSTADLTVYENVMAMVETEGKAQPIAVGALVHVGDTWRLIDAPQLADEVANSSNEYKPFFFAMPRTDRGPEAQAGKPTERMQELMNELQKLGEITPQSTTKDHNRRAEILKLLADESDTSEVRAQWYRQLADTLSAAVQTGSYDAGVEKLKELGEALKGDPKDDQLAAYVEFRRMAAEHGQELAKPDAPFADIQKKWIEELTTFVQGGKKFPDTADAMMELAIAEEFGGDEDKALKWYETIARDFPESPNHKKAAGAKLRLSCVGKPIPLQGKLYNANGNFDLAKLKGKAVLIQYWATWCEPCKADLPLLQNLRSKFKEFEVVGVCLDNSKAAMVAFLKEEDLHWPQLFDEGGLDSRYANELGIQTLPTMILVDKQGKVVNRNIRAQDLQAELMKILK